MSEFPYPPARRLDLAELIGGQVVADPYRWLEDASSDETRSWLAGQDALYARQADALPGRDALTKRIGELLGAGETGIPAWRGGRRFWLRRAGGQEHSVLYTEAPGDGERALLDPMVIDPSGSTTLDSWQPDKEGRLLAYELSAGGSEESDLRVIDTVTGEHVDGPIDRCRYGQVAWLPGGKAFYYSRRLAPGAVPAGEEQYHRRVYLHRVGSSAADDVLVFGEGREKTNYYMVSVSRDGRWLAIGASAGTAPRNDLWLADLVASGESAPRLVPVQEGVDAHASCHVGNDGRLYIFTDRGAPRGRLAVADPAKPGFGGWRDLIGADPAAVLTGYAILDGAELSHPVLLASWTRHAISEVTAHDMDTGAAIGAVPLPGLGTVTGLSERPAGGHEAWIGYTDHLTPAMVLRYDARDGSVRTWEQAPASAKVPGVMTRQVSYESADGTTVRMLVIAADGDSTNADGGNGDGRNADGGSGDGGNGDGRNADGGSGDGGNGDGRNADGGNLGTATRTPRPTILYGYGGFGISMTPAYSASVLAWTEAGGRYAIAGLRGGSEEGEDWHRAGMRERKQAVFDDFRAAAERLIADGWTSSGQLAISGGSNGGLLVGAAITQRPDLYAAAICSAPLLDMVRYERFGLGETWTDEYGTAADPKELAWLLAYSPYHHVTDAAAYPAVLFTVFDSDTRVDPMHARKMCAALQHATSAPFAQRPVLLRRESDVGHAARAVSRFVSLSAETLAFAGLRTGLYR
jgi:prolyl oligopeptidase